MKPVARFALLLLYPLVYKDIFVLPPKHMLFQMGQSGPEIKAELIAERS